MWIAWLKLMRVPLVLTAVADSLTGYFITRPAVEGLYGVPPLLALLSALLYSGGMVINDVEDHLRDKKIHPERPIPSGLVTRNQALIFAGILLFPTILIGFAISTQTLVVTMILIALTYTYNHVFKQYRIPGSLNMGLLRFFNFALGMSANLEFSEMTVKLMVLPGILLAYVALLTMISTMEEAESKREEVMILALLQIFVVLGANMFLDSITAILFSLVLAGALAYKAGQVWKDCTTDRIRDMVLWSLMGIVVIDGMIALGQEHRFMALILLFGFLPATWGWVKLFRHV